MVYLVKTKDQKVMAFYSEAEMISAGFAKADKTATEKEFNSNGCYARIIDGGIVVGKTEAEIAEEKRQEEIAGYKARLESIDRQAGASRVVRDACMAVANIIVLLGVTDQQIEAETDPARKAAMQTLKGFNPAAHQGLKKVEELENQAEHIRNALEVSWP